MVAAAAVPAAPAPQAFLAGMPAPRPGPAPTVVAAPRRMSRKRQRRAPVPTPTPVLAPKPVAPAAVAPRPQLAIAAPVPRPVPVPEVLAPGDDPNFPHLALLKPEVAFWTKVLADWSENQSVVHSMDDVEPSTRCWTSASRRRP